MIAYTKSYTYKSLQFKNIYEAGYENAACLTECQMSEDNNLLPSTFSQQRTSSSLKKVQMVDYNSFTQVFDTRELTGMTTTLK